MAHEIEIAIFLNILILIVVVAITMSSIRIIAPWEQGLYIRLGSYVGKLDPGMRFVVPLTSHVVRVDLRTQKLDVPMQEVVMKNRVPAKVEAMVYVKVVDAQKSFFEINDYKLATTALASTVIRTTFSEMTAVEVAQDRDKVNKRLRDMIDEAVDPWGVNVEAFELGRFEAEGKDLWKELAHPAPIMQLKLRSRTPIEEAAAFQVMAARALLEKLEWDHRDISSFKEKLDGAQKALESGDHEGALRIALGVIERGMQGQ